MQPLRSDPNLARFIIKGRATGKQLGIGSYGLVEEIEVNGLLCAGKKIHEALIDADNAGVENVTSKYVQECQLMSNLRHPNITQFLGVCFISNCQLPVLVMERLDGSLDDLLEFIPNIPLALKRSILDDVARGLLYLHSHSPQIIHRDLTAKNVLLTSLFAAKITNFGNSRIVNQQPDQLARTLSRFPGTLVYMSPEALEAPSCYGPSLDVFSFGHLTLFVGTQIFPGNLLQHNYTDPNDPDRLLGRSEVERRIQHFEQLYRILPGGNQHLLVQLIKYCLRNTPSQRPTAEYLVGALGEMRADIEGSYGELATIDAVRQVKMIRALKAITESSTNQLSEEVQQLRQQLEAVHIRCEVELHQKDEEIRQRNIQLNQAQVEIATMQADLRQKHLLIHQKNTQLDQYISTSHHQRIQLQQKDEELQQKGVELCTLQRELQRLQTPSSELRISLTMKWRRGKDMPFEMRSYPGAVLYKDKVYIGGGVASLEREMQTVMVYDPKQDSYDTLPPYEYKWFSIAAVNNQLVLVGGQDVETERKTNKLGVWNEECKQWTQPLPPMTTACHSPSVASHNNRWLVVIGGFSDGTNLSKVEILDTTELGQWHSAASLPQPCNQLSSAIIGNTCYLLGGYGIRGASKKVFSVSLEDLIHQAVSLHPASVATPSPWKILPDTPLTYSTALSFKGVLLSVGGREQSTDIYYYQAGSSSWIKAGELPTGRSYCAGITFPNGNLFVAGGYDTEQQVDIALVE